MLGSKGEDAEEVTESDRELKTFAVDSSEAVAVLAGGIGLADNCEIGLAAKGASNC